ncbi:MAG: putative enoyl-CoA hydratase echA8 [Syntrophus sp. PtaB.Bin001]|nr:MAG: putative enoyl-CoA hydratase echA8 [Syntrophus sp. PtaB.Bin001]
MYETINLTVEEGIATVTLNRPPVNPLNSKMFAELGQVAAELEADPAVRVVIITGSGDKAFVAGADINEMKDLDPVSMYRFCQVSGSAFRALENISKPTIAAINGLAFGGGCELTLTCDFRIAADTAKFALPEINLGIIPGGGGTQRLPRLLGAAKAKEMLMLGDIIDADAACQCGLVNKVVPLSGLMDEAKALAKKLKVKSSLALSIIKNSVNQGLNMNLGEALDFETKNFILVFTGDDRREGFGAFVEKRRPNFK